MKAKTFIPIIIIVALAGILIFLIIRLPPKMELKKSIPSTINKNMMIPKGGNGFDRNLPMITEDNELAPETARIVSPLQSDTEASKGITPEASSGIMLGPTSKVITQIVDESITVRWPDTGEDVNAFRVYRRIYNQQDWQWLGDIQVTEYNPDAWYEFKDITPKQGNIYIYGIKTMYIPKTGKYIRESRIAESASILFQQPIHYEYNTP